MKVEERHTIGELFADVFRMKKEMESLTQEEIDLMPQLMRYINRIEIRRMGLKPDIDPEFRRQVRRQKPFPGDEPIGESAYYRVLEGGVGVGE